MAEEAKNKEEYPINPESNINEELVNSQIDRLEDLDDYWGFGEHDTCLKVFG